jgi:hypothetical protein
MSPTAKGLVVAAIDLFAIALLIAILEASERHWMRDVFEMVSIVQLVGAIPALALGAALGWLAGRLDVARAPVLVGIALAVVIAGGLLTEPRWIYVASIPTVIWMVRLERWTRRAPGEPKPPLSATACGAVLAGATLATVAVILGLALRYEHHHRHIGFETAMEVFAAGLAPALAFGVALGWIARQLATASFHVRRVVLCAPMVAVIVLLGAATEEALVAPMLAPAIGAILVLERVTRSQLPTARTLPARHSISGNQSSGGAI